MAGSADVRRAQPEDQADGLRRLFSARTVRFIPVVSNPFVAREAVLIRQVCAALEQLGLYTLLVDARVPCRAVPGYAAGGIQVLTDRTSCLMAHGVSARTGQTVLQAVVDAAPLSQAVVVHGGAAELLHLFTSGEVPLSPPRPIVLCDERPAAVTHAYAALKVLSQRAHWDAHDLLVGAATGSAGIQRVKERLERAAALFFGGVRHDVIHVDPAAAALSDAAPASLMAFMEASMGAAAAFVLPDVGRHGPAPVTAPSFLQSMV